MSTSLRPKARTLHVRKATDSRQNRWERVLYTQERRQSAQPHRSIYYLRARPSSAHNYCAVPGTPACCPPPCRASHCLGTCVLIPDETTEPCTALEPPVWICIYLHLTFLFRFPRRSVVGRRVRRPRKIRGAGGDRAVRHTVYMPCGRLFGRLPD